MLGQVLKSLLMRLNNFLGICNARGPDGISSRRLKMCEDDLAQPIQMLVHLCGS